MCAEKGPYVHFKKKTCACAANVTDYAHSLPPFWAMVSRVDQFKSRLEFSGLLQPNINIANATCN